MAKYVLRKLADGMLGEGERIFPQLVSSGVANIGDLAKIMEHSATFTRGDVEGVLKDFAEAIADAVASGRTVKIDGLGTFRLVLGLTDEQQRGNWTDSAGRIAAAHNVKIKTLNFLPDKQLMRTLSQKIKLEREGGIPSGQKPTTTLAQRRELACSFLEEHNIMRVADYARLTGLSRTIASLELRQLAADPASGITATGSRASKVYIKRSSKA